MRRLVRVERCNEYGHWKGPHDHVEWTERCKHGKPVEYACHDCDFGFTHSRSALLTDV